MKELTMEKINYLKKKAKIEIDREIYYIYFSENSIAINGYWEVSISGDEDIDRKIIHAIEIYSTKRNLEWENSSAYSMWCD